jgi:NADPH-dependent 2,4-dienoyl-CoA reductase/sulfur reductase-like enzyme
MWSKVQTLKAGIPLLSACVVAVQWSPAAGVGCAAKGAGKADVKVLIIGGGTAGVGVAGMLGNEGFKHVTVVEPRAVHYYQPLWTLVAGGLQAIGNSERLMQDCLTKNTTWLQKAAVSMNPEENLVTLSDGTVLHYDYLVVGAGMESDYSTIPGMAEAMNEQDSGVVSTYDFNYAQKTWNTIKNFKSGGRAIFTMPATPVKCPGAPQKIMWLFEEHLRDHGLRDKTSVEYWVPGGAMFGVKKYGDMLTVLQKERNVIPHFGTTLASIDWENKKATFKDSAGKTSVEDYALLHVVPAMRPPPFVRTSKLANETGFIAVDQGTLQSTKYPNVFGIGDCTTTPNSKTAAAITSQAPVLVHNLERLVNGEEPNAVYNGYASCPLIVGKKQVIMAEFGYGGKVMETFSPETGKFPYNLLGQEGAGRQRFFFWMKDTMFPYVYWNFWTKGKWFGNSGIFKPTLELKETATKE